jgi:tryptophan 2,3-dioxygenase
MGKIKTSDNRGILNNFYYDRHAVDPAQQGEVLGSDVGMLYGEYLQLEKILSAQRMLSPTGTQPVHDEHLFIVIHQGMRILLREIFTL